MDSVSARPPGTTPSSMLLMMVLATASPHRRTEALPEIASRTLPQVDGQPAAVAVASLRAAGYDVPSPKNMHALHAVVQPTDEDVVHEKRVNLEIAPPDTVEAVYMPDLTGLSTRQAVLWSHAAGIDVKIEGQGMVVSQSPKAGELLTAKAVLRCR